MLGSWNVNFYNIPIRSMSGGIKWDEDNLSFNEANKSSTMIIDEPDTPYHYGSDSGTLDCGISRK